MKLVYIHLRNGSLPIEYKLTDEEVDTAKLHLASNMFDFVDFGGLVLPKINIEQVKFTEVSE